MITAKAKSNCWTCKERKVGCDRALPECVNCVRSKRSCKGYGLKLAWPDKFDGRRKQKKYQAAPEGSTKHYIIRDGKFTFLNTTVDALEGRRLSVQELVRRSNNAQSGSAEVLPKALDLYRFGEGEGALLSYYDSVLARMITTIDDNTNGFRLDLIPMAMSSSNTSSRSLLQATLALSSFHLGRPEDALKHKVQAIKALSESFQAEDSSRIAQFAACMMLCVYSVFDASDTSWHLHLQAAKTIAHTLSQSERDLPSLQFLELWFEYHHTFSVYSHPADSASEQEIKPIVLPESTVQNQKIIGLFGCSSELIRLISCINQLRSWQTTPSAAALCEGSNPIPPCLLIQDRLLNLKQEIHIQPGETTGTINHIKITLTAEFYRIGALLYLYGLAPPSTIAQAEIQALVTQGFAVLDQMEVCTSPWPLLILACSVKEDVYRIKVMRVIEEGAKERRVGNYHIIKSLVQEVWKQQDLAADDKEDKRVDWRELIEPGIYVPSFI